MKEYIETAVPCIKFVAGVSNEARKTATGHSGKTLCEIVTKNKGLSEITDIKTSVITYSRAMGETVFRHVVKTESN